MIAAWSVAARCMRRIYWKQWLSTRIYVRACVCVRVVIALGAVQCGAAWSCHAHNVIDVVTNTQPHHNHHTHTHTPCCDSLHVLSKYSLANSHHSLCANSYPSPPPSSPSSSSSSLSRGRRWVAAARWPRRMARFPLARCLRLDLSNETSARSTRSSFSIATRRTNDVSAKRYVGTNVVLEPNIMYPN